MTAARAVIAAITPYSTLGIALEVGQVALAVVLMAWLWQTRHVWRTPPTPVDHTAQALAIVDARAHTPQVQRPQAPPTDTRPLPTIDTPVSAGFVDAMRRDAARCLLAQAIYTARVQEGALVAPPWITLTFEAKVHYVELADTLMDWSGPVDAPLAARPLAVGESGALTRPAFRLVQPAPGRWGARTDSDQPPQQEDCMDEGTGAERAERDGEATTDQVAQPQADGDSSGDRPAEETAPKDGE